jgi:CRP-like cAMP-binding protein
MDALTFLTSHSPLFAGCAESELEPLAAESSLRTLAAEQVALRAGMTVEALHVVATGGVGVWAKVPGQGTQRVAELGPGDVFGEASMIERSVASATVKAGEKGAIILLIPEEPFRRLVNTNLSVAERVKALIAARRSPPKPAA